MNNATVTPTDVPQRFEVQETFFSLTDTRGVILDGNEVFARVSGYPLERMIGRNHNLIRHPRVPRAVFHLMWSEIKAGRTFMGYVQNLAANANHYWVFAVITPIGEGHLSVRIKPTSDRLEAVASLYARIVAAENNRVATGTSEGAAAAESVSALLEGLRGLGWASYDGFAHESLITEIKQRDRLLADRRARLFPAALPVESSPELVRLHAQAEATYRRLEVIFTSLDRFLSGARVVDRHRQAVADIGGAFQLNALNAHLAAHPLGEAGVVIGTVAGFLNGHARDLDRHMRTLSEHIVVTSAAVADIASNVCAARIQMEMLLSFLGEMAGAKTARGDAAVRIRHLQEASRHTGRAAASAIHTMLKRLPLLHEDRERLRKDVVALQATQITGITEAARLGMAGVLQGMFAEMRAQVERTRTELDAMGAGVTELFQLTRQTPQAVTELLASIDQLGADCVGSGPLRGSAAG